MKTHLQKWRISQGLTQTQAAELFGVNQPAVAKWEAEQVSSSKALKVHQVTGIPLHTLRPDIYPTPSRPRASAA